MKSNLLPPMSRRPGRRGIKIWISSGRCSLSRDRVMLLAARVAAGMRGLKIRVRGIRTWKRQRIMGAEHKVVACKTAWWLIIEAWNQIKLNNWWIQIKKPTLGSRTCYQLNKYKNIKKNNNKKISSSKKRNRNVIYCDIIIRCDNSINIINNLTIIYNSSSTNCSAIINSHNNDHKAVITTIIIRI